MTQTATVRERILSHGLVLASAQGLNALSLGDVARDLDLPRSGLFHHFASKDALQLGILEQAALLFSAEVIEPAVALPAGEPRIRTMFVRWLAWSRSPRLKGGCPFVHASAESETLAPDVRIKIREFLDHFSGVLKQALMDGKERAICADLDCDQFVFELYGLYLSHHFWHWSMKDSQAYARTMKAFDRMMAAARA